ncbi:Os01g0248150 [Oryza sativa Japonica Group]|uniref:Os01g0248150 protein n=1 Tax=Oryza sativa subsp. japonica TaxID=39947 RepID=A0A0P0V0K7_ORYSJ|nr:Os01g0248150 [Oryza sativa Japonica Group]
MTPLLGGSGRQAGSWRRAAVASGLATVGISRTKGARWRSGDCGSSVGQRELKPARGGGCPPSRSGGDGHPPHRSARMRRRWLEEQGGGDEGVRSTMSAGGRALPGSGGKLATTVPARIRADPSAVAGEAQWQRAASAHRRAF